MPTGDYLTQLGKEISISLAILLAVPQKKMREFGGFRCLLLLFQFCLLNIAGYITLLPGDFVAPRFQSAVVESRFDTKPKPTAVQCATPCPVQKVAREELYSNRSKAQSLCYPMCVGISLERQERERESWSDVVEKPREYQRLKTGVYAIFRTTFDGCCLPRTLRFSTTAFVVVWGQWRSSRLFLGGEVFLGEIFGAPPKWNTILQGQRFPRLFQSLSTPLIFQLIIKYQSYSNKNFNLNKYFLFYAFFFTLKTTSNKNHIRRKKVRLYRVVKF